MNPLKTAPESHFTRLPPAYPVSESKKRKEFIRLGDY
jgi:hypothetical protein